MSKILEDGTEIPTDLLTRNYSVACGTAISVFIFGQFALIGDIFSSRNRMPQLSSTARQTNLLIGGAFVVSAMLQVLRVLTGPKKKNYYLGSFITTLTVNSIAMVSVLTTMTGQWGGMCENVLG